MLWVKVIQDGSVGKGRSDDSGASLRFVKTVVKCDARLSRAWARRVLEVLRVVGYEAALPISVCACDEQASAFLGGEDANHFRTGGTSSGAGRSMLCSGYSPTVSYCHILRNLGVGMELTGETELTVATRIFAASYGPVSVAEMERADGSVRNDLDPPNSARSR